MKVVIRLEPSQAMSKNDREMINIIIENSILSLGKPEISVHQDLQTLKMVEHYYRGLSVGSIQKDMSMASFLEQVRRNNMMARLLGRDLRSKFERTYQYEVFGTVETVIVPPWHKRVLDEHIEEKKK